MIAMPYPAGAALGTVDRHAKKEIMPMMRENGPSPNRYRLLVALLRVLLFVALVGLVVAVTFMDPGRTFSWVVDNIIPMIMVGGAIFVVFGLAALVLFRLYGKHRHHL